MSLKSTQSDSSGTIATHLLHTHFELTHSHSSQLTGILTGTSTGDLRNIFRSSLLTFLRTGEPSQFPYDRHWPYHRARRWQDPAAWCVGRAVVPMMRRPWEGHRYCTGIIHSTSIRRTAISQLHYHGISLFGLIGWAINLAYVSSVLAMMYLLHVPSQILVVYSKGASPFHL